MARLSGPVAKGHDAPKNTLAQKGEVGFCPCCGQATHVAVPATYVLGCMDTLKRLGLAVWAEEGLRACRRHAAIEHVLGANYTPLPVGWDWAARPLDLQAPDFLTRAVCRGAAQPIPTVAQSAARSQGNKAIKDKPTQDTQNTPSFPPMEVEPTHAENPIASQMLIPPSAKGAMAANTNKGKKKGPSSADPLAQCVAEGKVKTPEGWRGFRRPRPTPDASSGGKSKGSHDSRTSWSSQWKDREK